MKIEEIPLIFSCQSDHLLGMIHKPDNAHRLGVLVLVGGPQYKVGSHRQFVLLARALAEKGIPVMRFDFRGMGDSTGEERSFTDVDADIDAAIDAFYQNCPDLTGIVIWGLCDAASAALFYAYQDTRVKGLVLLNPWVFTEQGAAKTFLKYYYLQRIFSPDLWRKVMTLQFDYRQSFVSLISIIKNITRPGTTLPMQNSIEKPDRVDTDLSLPIRMRECFQRFKNPVLLILSGRDLTADEFRETLGSDSDWQGLINAERVKCVDLSEADHTFSTQKWRDEVASVTLRWLQQLQ